MIRTRDERPSWASLEGLPNPLGATWIAEEEAWNFAVYSEHAEHVMLLLYAEPDLATPVLTQRLDHLRNKSGPVTGEPEVLFQGNFRLRVLSRVLLTGLLLSNALKRLAKT